MSIPVIDTLKGLGDFPVADAADIGVGNKRLDTVLSEKASTATVAELRGDVTSVQNGKVDKVSGKGLSTNDYTTAEKNKLAGLNVDSSMSSTSGNAIANKAVSEALSGKVDKVSGKGLSSNDYSDSEKSKVASNASDIAKLKTYFTLVD